LITLVGVENLAVVETENAILVCNLDQSQGVKKIVETLKKVANRHDASPARTALAWLLSRENISSVLIAARNHDHLEDNIKAVDMELTEDDIKELDEVSDPGIPYPRWMVIQQSIAEDPRAKTLEPERFKDGIPWEDLRFKKMPLEG